MTFRHRAWLPLSLAALFGLGIPRAFTLLYAVLLGVLWMGRQRGGAPCPSWLLWSAFWLVTFGITYSVAQVGWRIWIPPQAYLQEILAVVVLPTAALLAGWMLPRFRRLNLSWLFLAYALGALIYALLCLALSRTPWWNLAETFHANVKVPWGSTDLLNVRSVEQRAFPFLACLPIAFGLVVNPTLRLRCTGLRLMFVSLLASYVAWAYHGRLGLVVLGVAFAPWLLVLCHRFSGLIPLLGVAAASVVTFAWAGNGYLCDERWSLQREFVQRMMDAPWGGRLIQFRFASCVQGLSNQFGSIHGASTFSPHNVVLDIWNDAGWPSALSLVLSIIPLIVMLCRGFLRSVSSHSWRLSLALRWSMLSVLIVEWLLQPFFYSDQLMFSLGFVLVGTVLAEFSEEGSAVTTPLEGKLIA